MLDGERARAQPQGVRPARRAGAPRGRGRHARGPDGARVGRELVRLDQDARRPRRAGCAGKLGDDPSAPRFVHTVRGVGLPLHARPRSGRREPARAPAAGAGLRAACWRSSRCSCRWWLSVRDRVDAEVEPQALSQAEVVAATRVRPPAPASCAGLDAAAARRRARPGGDRRRRTDGASPTAPAPARSAPTTGRGPEIAARAARAGACRSSARSETLGTADPRHRGAGRAARPADGRRAGDPERRRRAPRGAAARRSACALIGVRRAGCSGSAPGALIAAPGRAAAAPARRRRRAASASGDLSARAPGRGLAPSSARSRARSTR